MLGESRDTPWDRPEIFFTNKIGHLGMRLKHLICSTFEGLYNVGRPSNKLVYVRSFN